MKPTIEKTGGGYLLMSESTAIFCETPSDLDDALDYLESQRASEDVITPLIDDMIEMAYKNLAAIESEEPTGFEHDLYYTNRGLIPPPPV